MPRLPRITAAELLPALRRDGWFQVRQRGSHVQFKHAAKPGIVTIPRHSGAIIRPKLLESILEQAGPTADELLRLL